MKIFFILSTFFYFIPLLAQVPDDDIYTIVEQYPSFPGGENAWYTFIDTYLTYPIEAQKQGIQGKVWVEFIVDEFGNVSNVKVLRGIGVGCNEEAVRVVSMSPKWNPGKQSGHNVKVKYAFPIHFKLPQKPSPN